MIPRLSFLFIIALTLTFSTYAYSKKTSDSKIENLEVLEWTVTGSWGAVAVVHHLRLKNSSSKTYKKLKVRICYESDSRPGNVVSTQIGVIEIEVLPNTEKTYLKGGTTLGAGSPIAKAVHFEILDAK